MKKWIILFSFLSTTPAFAQEHGLLHLWPTAEAYCNGAGVCVGGLTLGGNLILPAAGSIEATGRTKLTFPADGDTLLAINAGTQGVRLDVGTADDELRLFNESGALIHLRLRSTGKLYLTDSETVTGYVNVGSNRVQVYSPQGLYAEATANNSTVGSGGFQTLTYHNASSGQQYGAYFGPVVRTSGTGGFTLIGGNSDMDGATGTGEFYMIDLHRETVSIISVRDDGDTRITGTIKTEVAVGDVPAEPHACDAAHSGVIVTVDDTNNTAYDEPCVCLNLDGTGYDWRQFSDVAGTACVF